MTKIKKLSAKLLVFVLAFTMLTTGIIGGASGFTVSAFVESVGGSDSLVRTSLKEIKNILTSVVYRDYLDVYANVNDAEKELPIDLANYLDNGTDTTATVEKKENGTVLYVGDDGKISWNVDVENDALYNIEIEYFTGDISVSDKDGKVVSEGKSSTIERMILIDGKVPYKESRSIVLEKRWAHEYTVVDDDGKPVLKDGKEQVYLSDSQEFADFVIQYENNTKDSKRLFLKDITGNEIKPEKVLLSSWAKSFLSDSTGYYNDPLKFFLSKGTHTLTIDTIKEPIGIKSITLKNSKSLDTYDQYLKKHADVSNYSGDKVVMIQAEYPTAMSEQTIYQLNDRSSTITIPQDASLVKLNDIGGDKWQYVGQWIEWVVEVPETGFYNIIPRSKQDIYSGIYVSRRIYIDEVIPFKEASYLRFNYSDNWQTESLNDGKTNFKFYLEKGIRKIRFEVVLGDMSEILSTVETSLNQINAYYRKILMITGPEPDSYRDYHFERLIPDVVKGLKEQSEILQGVSDKLKEITGEKGEHAATLDKVAVYLNRMGTYASKIASSMGTLKDYCGSLGTWLTDTQNQPLFLDYLCIQAVDAEVPQNEPGFFASFWGEIQKFYVSFFADYNSIGSMKEEGVTSEDLKKVAIEVWTSTSREQAQIIRSLVDDEFTIKYNIPVEVKLVVGGTLLPATLAGTGPDVSMGGTQGDPVNYAIRSAVKSLNTTTGDSKIGYNFNDLSKWADHPVYKNLIDKIDTFDQVKERFAPTAMVPITLYSETYAIPENMGFSMMFYRKDIFSELKIDVPNTWSEFNNTIYTLQSKMLDIGFPGGLPGSMILMYQQDEDLYDMGNYDEFYDLYHKNGITDEMLKEKGLTYTNEEGKVVPKTDGMTINLDSDVSLAAFQKVCNYFTMYDFPANFIESMATRFRQGTMPLVIVDYTFYNQLIVFAPEIKGLWEFTPLPGTAGKDDTINNTTIAAITPIIMMRSVTDENALAAWTYMQWWTSAEIQSAYGNEMVALLGPSAKQPTANLEALLNMAWSKDEYDNLRAQFNAVTCTPEFPGSYIIPRYGSFAFLEVYNDGAEPVEALRAYIKDINSELSRKRAEFGLPIVEEIEISKNNKN